MFGATATYCSTLGDRFGRGWNRFWFAPADPINLAVLRIGAGLVALWLHLAYSFDLVRLFGADGWLPVETIRTLEAESWRFSYLDYLRQPTDLLVAHVGGAVVLAMFTLGLLTRVSTVLAAVVLLSYVHRAPLLTSQVEPVLSMLVIYLALGPAGACLSIDRWQAERRARARGAAADALDRPGWGANLSLRLIQVHLALLYGMMGLCKLWGDAWWAGSGVWFLIARPDARLVDLTDLAAYPMVINAWTHAIVLFELGFAILIWQPLARPLLLALGLVNWVALALVTGNLPWAAAMLVANMAFASPDWLRSWLPRRTAASPANSPALAQVHR